MARVPIRLPLILFPVSALMLWWCTMLVRRGLWATHHTIGIAIALPAFALFALAHYQLGDSFSVRAKARRLVTTGLYSRIRNPIYVFSWFIVLGETVFARVYWLLVVLAVLIPVQVRRARAEAQVLEATFGDDYRRYRRGTWF